MVSSNVQVKMGRGSMTTLPQKQLDAVGHIIESILNLMGVKGIFSVTCITQTVGGPAHRGKFRIGVYVTMTRTIKITHQLGDNDSRFEYDIHVPPAYPIDDFYRKFVDHGSTVRDVVIGSKTELQRLETKSRQQPGETAAVPPVPTITPPPHSPASIAVASVADTTPVVTSKRKRSEFSICDKDSVTAFLECLAEKADILGVVTREQISEVFNGLFEGLTPFDIGQKIRRLKEQGMLEMTDKNTYRICKISNYRKVNPALSQPLATPPPVVLSPSPAIAPPPPPVVPSGASQALMGLWTRMAEDYLQAKSLSAGLMAEVGQLEQEKATIDAKIADLKGSLASVEKILIPGGSHEEAARKLGKI